MKWSKSFLSSCLAAMFVTTGVLAQEQPVEVRVRKLAGPDGKVVVVEEEVEEKQAEPKKEEGKNEEQPLRARVIRRVQELSEKVAGGKAGETLDVVTEDAWGEMPQSDYWIGVQIAPVSPEIRKHLPVKHGVLVLHVYPDSPATKAELKADDILLQAGDVKIETGPDLVKAVDAAKETELSFLVLREGKERKLSVTPTKREEGGKVLNLNRLTMTAPRLEKLQAAQRQFEQALQALRAETEQETPTVDFMLVRPGAFLAHAASIKMPDDLTVQITKEGNKPPKIHVKQGDKRWDVSSDKLDTLPKDVRPHVERMLHGPGLTFGYEAAPKTFQTKVSPPIQYYAPAVTTLSAPAVPASPPVVARAATAWSHAIAPHASDAKLDQILKKLDTLAGPDLEEMKKELKALRKEVDELRKKGGDEKQPARER